MSQNVESFFSPKSVAVVGVSNDPVKLGSVVLTNLIEAGFQGALYPVNPKYTDIYGFKCYDAVSSIPEEVELAVIVVPALHVLNVVKDCAVKKVKAIIIITAGFKETGLEGAKLENDIMLVAREAGIRVMGPNCLGVISSPGRLNASFAASKPAAGNIAFMSQSGAFCTAMLDMAIPTGLGFTHFVSFGNKADVSEIDLLENWLADEKVKVIGAYLEDIKYGKDFLRVIAESQNQKPIIIFKPGKTEQAKKAISSHTGALAGSIETFNTAMRQYNIFEAETIRSMFNLMMGFSWEDLPKGNNVALVTNAGGPGIITTDYIIEASLKIAQLSEETKSALRNVLPPTASVNNPVDVVGDANAQRYYDSIEVLAHAEEVDAVMVLLTPQLVTQIEDTAKVLVNAAKKYNKPVIPVYLGNKYVSPALHRFHDSRLGAYKDPADAVEVLKALTDYQQFLNNQENVKALRHENYKIFENLYGGTKAEVVRNTTNAANLANAANKAGADGERVNAAGGTVLNDDLARDMMIEVGVDVPRQKLCSTVEEAVEFAKTVFPVVLKASNADIAHKTDFKAIYLGVNSEDELRQSFNQLSENIKKVLADGNAVASTVTADVDGGNAVAPTVTANAGEGSDISGTKAPLILVQEQIKYEELIFIGSNRDGDSSVYKKDHPGFGHLIAFGQGGIYTEVYKDIEYGLLPFGRSQAADLFGKTKVFKILDGARGKEKLATEKVIDSIMAIQKLLVLYPEIKSIDINPLLVSVDRAVAVDVKIYV